MSLTCGHAAGGFTSTIEGFFWRQIHGGSRGSSFGRDESHRQRAGASAVAVVGVAGVVLVFVAVLSIAEGLQAALAGAGSPDTANIMRGGSDSELGSALALADTRIIKDAAGVRRADSGPVASAELFVVVDLLKRSTGTVANVALRGVEPAAFGVRDEVRLVEGRMFRPGTNEIIVGRIATAQFLGLELDSVQRWGESTWEVVGIFEADGTISESEIWCDARVLQPAHRRGDSFQSVLARLDSADVFDRFRTTLTADPRLDVMVEREDAYYQERSELVHALITGRSTATRLRRTTGRRSRRWRSPLTSRPPCSSRAVSTPSSWASSAGCSRPSAPPVCRSSQPCGSLSANRGGDGRYRCERRPLSSPPHVRKCLTIGDLIPPTGPCWPAPPTERRPRPRAGRALHGRDAAVFFAMGRAAAPRGARDRVRRTRGRRPLHCRAALHVAGLHRSEAGGAFDRVAGRPLSVSVVS